MNTLNTNQMIETLRNRRAELLTELSQVEKMLGLKTGRRQVRNTRGANTAAVMTLLAAGPASSKRIRQAVTAAGGSDSSGGSVIDYLMKCKRITRDENGLYNLAAQ